eukprot:TRINITY_DN80453_c0_g1_i1.p1 TRINITY_DN80453_c0_g1~~TRINITY_DN80453_c0_g1_i1.p1  ORF type:complete len:175 (+),score=18.89 TRINITY_DN80453_c0_g1_i1:46-570(+)
MLSKACAHALCLVIVVFFETSAALTEDQLPKIPQHLCCAALGKERADVRAMMPEAFNHSAIRAVKCTDTKGVDHLHRVGTACSYCLCLFDDGAEFWRSPSCCSLTKFGSPGVNEVTGQPICQKYRQTYNLYTFNVRSCELRYDLYSFKAHAFGLRPAAFAVIVTILSAVSQALL